MEESRNHPILAPFTHPGEEVIGIITEILPNYTVAKPLLFLSTSPNRVKPKCKHFTECSGCQLQHFGYEEQLKMKEEKIRGLFSPLSLDPELFHETVASPNPYFYRTKLTPHYPSTPIGTLAPIGFTNFDPEGAQVDLYRCPIATKNINDKLPELRRKTEKHIMERKRGGTLLLRENLLKDGEIKVVTKNKLLCREEVRGMGFFFSSGSFFQVNRSILESLTNHVISEAKEEGVKYLADCYCGAGLFMLLAASQFSRVFGVEIERTSIDAINRTAREHDIQNFTAIEADSSMMFQLLEAEEAPPEETTLVLDPSVKGCSPSFLSALLHFHPRKVVYVSCNPETQVRDLAFLLDSGRFKVRQVRPFDLFPQTKHLECVVTLERLDLSPSP